MRFQIAQALAHFLWEGAAIAVVLCVLLQVLRDARARYNACAWALALMCLSPVATFLWLAPHSTSLQGTRGIVLNTSLPASGAPTLSWFEAHAALLFWFWLAGAMLLLLRAAALWWRARNLVTRDFEPLHPGVEVAAHRLAEQLGAKRVRFRASARVASALVFGWLKPVVVLPAAALGRLSEAEIEALLAHELAHVIRGDFLVNLLQTTAECVLFYHPLVWWVSTRMREERELCCDDIAVAVCRDEVLYSRALLRLEELRMEPALAATGGRLALRIRRLLVGCETDRMNLAPGFALLLLLGVSVALLAQNAPPEPPAPPAPPAATSPEAPLPPPPPASPEGPADSKTIYRAGDDVAAPRLIYKVEPGYTKEAQAAHLEGRVFLSTVISPEGIARDINVIDSLDKGLDEKAIEAIRKWRFEPGRKDGKPVPVRANIEVEFRLLDQPAVPPVAAVPPVPSVAPVPAVAPVPSPMPQPAVAPEPPEPPEPGPARPHAPVVEIVRDGVGADVVTDKALQEMNLGARAEVIERQTAERVEVEIAQEHANAEQMSEQAAKSEALEGKSKNANKAELERRRQYAQERFGVNTDRGKVYIHYGPPDEIESHTSQGKGGTDIWRYKDSSKGKVLLELEFQDGKQVRHSGGLAASI